MINSHAKVMKDSPGITLERINQGAGASPPVGCDTVPICSRPRLSTKVIVDVALARATFIHEGRIARED
jgi:hypothetical protein